MRPKVALCMPYKNDEDVLEWTLDKIPSYFSNYLFLDTGSVDRSTRLIATRFPLSRIEQSNDNTIDFGKWRNTLISMAEKQGAEWVFMLDSDETLFIPDYDAIFNYVEYGTSEAYRLSRIDFVGNKGHYRADVYPDWQGRLFKLNKGYYYAPKIHAQLHKDNEIVQGQYLPHITIYHYGWTRDENKKKLHYLNAERVKQGLPILATLPNGASLSSATGQPPKDEWKIYNFYGKQP